MKTMRKGSFVGSLCEGLGGIDLMRSASLTNKW